jgi:CheY-like chemotaxis protein
VAWNKSVKLINLDDQSIDQEIAKLICSMLHIECYSTASISEFLSKYRDYDGAILDYSMPEKDGSEIAEIIRSNISTYPIIFRSNYSSGSKQYERMIKYGNIIHKILSTGALQEFADFIKLAESYKNNK